MILFALLMARASILPLPSITAVQLAPWLVVIESTWVIVYPAGAVIRNDPTSTVELVVSVITAVNNAPGAVGAGLSTLGVIDTVASAASVKTVLAVNPDESPIDVRS